MRAPNSPLSISSLLVLASVLSCGGAQTSGSRASNEAVQQEPRTVGTPKLTPDEYFAQSRYSMAEAGFREALSGPDGKSASIGLSRVLVMRGRYREAIELLRRERFGAPLDRKASLIEATALFRSGELDEAVETLRQSPDLDGAEERLFLAELLLERGQREKAEPLLLSLVEDYNEDRIDPGDGRALARVARAAHLLRSPRDANQLFDEAEQASPNDVQILLWRGELFLEKYNPGRAEEVALQILADAPNHPEAKILLAGARFEKRLDFDEAERLAREALAINPALSDAHFWLTATLLKDHDLEQAEERIAAGLKLSPRSLSLMSLQATARFIADDLPGFERAKQRVLELNPEYSRFYQIVADFADWEHRYDEIIQLMREALEVDDEDAKATAQLGINLIRSGHQNEGVKALQTAFSKDPYNVRVFNTLNLYEEVIPERYATVDYGRFAIRYPKAEQPLLERYVPDLLKSAWDKFVERYDFEPETPVGVELYAERQSFAVRTSGLPRTAIQGVCFGKTLASMSLTEESFNLPLTLWHELSHVFHIQISRSRVPRWLTEGLAEYETVIERPEWAREHDPDLYRAAREGRLPSLTHMTKAFTRAEQMSDVATAYYASTIIVQYLAEEYGFDRLVAMLKAYGRGLNSQEVFRTVLSRSAEELDAEFRSYLKQRLRRYERQFVPTERALPLRRAYAIAKRAPEDIEAKLQVVRALLSQGRLTRAREALDQIQVSEKANKEAAFLRARLELVADRLETANESLQGLIADGDGFDVQMLRAKIADRLGDEAARDRAYEAAHQLDPTQSAPLFALWAVARQSGDRQREIEILKDLVSLEQHASAVHERLVELLYLEERYDELLELGTSAIYSNLRALDSHLMYARALLERGQLERARFELESAELCPGSTQEKAAIQVEFARLFKKQNDRNRAKQHAENARTLAATSHEVTAALAELGL